MKHQTADDKPGSSPIADDPRVAAVWDALAGVADPEIPTVNVVELGMIAGVRVDGDQVIVDMTPTFAGCPALDVIKADIARAVKAAGEPFVAVHVVYDPPWTSDRITEEGRRELKAFGLAPPGERCSGGAGPNLERTACPYCGSTDTDLESIFGPTLCRSMHYCHNCQQPFEHFKAV